MNERNYVFPFRFILALAKENSFSAPSEVTVKCLLVLTWYQWHIDMFSETAFTPFERMTPLGELCQVHKTSVFLSEERLIFDYWFIKLSGKE